MATKAAFARMNGLGNQIIVADMRGRADSITPAAAIRLASDSETAFDQIMAIHDPRTPGTDYYIAIINCDGTQAQACGNGTRCVVQALAAETGRRAFTFETRAGILTATEHDDGLISVDMGTPRFDWRDIPLAQAVADTRKIELQVGPVDAPVLHSPSIASMGNPHAVFWVDKDVWSYELDKFGPLLENHPIFPERANISIAHVTSSDTMDLRTWERGAGLTRACGSAACAAAVSAARTGRTGRKVTVNVPGGPLLIEWRDDDHVMMTGPAEWEFSGTFDPATGEWSRDMQGLQGSGNADRGAA
ncbi:diaminopimelate epimerase [Brucella sp. 10RB9214]|uniref:diaminopimelate epimerase n=1 Tax=unclassified Brucella TaxID=2632610 RepID=UPI000972B472|nr:MULTISPECIES: diaminopimelate epimerase [unclassified Brucella]APY13997.1 diaminopimelate epimerase [Brucella sp. 09RB8910]MRN47493.1 diaminopimelate epimerase [Brucella sp. 10RB9212]MRN50291.1 diaminopimelate epimerase [Brucella sp. 10RB9214]